MPEPPGPVPFGTGGNGPVLEELAVSVFLNGRFFTAAMTVPDRRVELAVGLLVTEQVIRSMDELESIREDGPCVRALTSDPFRVVVPRRGVITGCGGAASHLSERRLPKLPPEPQLDPDRVRSALAAVADPPAGLFSAVLQVLDGNPVVSDDLGLSTALARVLGAAVMAGTSRAEAVAVVSHRVTAELARAAVVAGIPVLATVGLVTGLAVELADRSGLCLCGNGSAVGFVCYAHPERLRS
ncbi:MAG: formate dehydrogenase accessory sulfurtransferase FdhD [Methanospirillum sp.]